MSCSPTVTTTGSLKWLTGRTTLLYPVNRVFTNLVSSSEHSAGPATQAHTLLRSSMRISYHPTLLTHKQTHTQTPTPILNSTQD